MVAMPTLDLIVVATWVALLCLVMVGQAVLLYVRHRFASRQAEGAARLAKAIAFPPGGRRGLAPRPDGHTAPSRAARQDAREAGTS
jgi:hypothetical protein